MNNTTYIVAPGNIPKQKEADLCTSKSAIARLQEERLCVQSVGTLG